MAAYGVKWHSDQTSPTLDRLESNVGLTAGASFNALSPWTMRRCNLWTDGTPTAYYGDRCYTDTDVTNMGQCMVQIPKFWYAVDSSLANHVAFYISDTATPSPAIRNLANTADLTFAVHPAFIVDTIAHDYAYISAYEVYYDGVSKLQSRGGVTPTTASSASYTISLMRAAAGAIGSGWHLSTVQAYSASLLLFIVEYASLNAQAVLGNGNGDTGGAIINTGTTTGYGNASYGATARNVAMSYRGIENLWGNVWTLLDGINLKADHMPWMKAQSNTAPYACDQFDGAGGTYKYIDTGLTIPAAGGNYTVQSVFLTGADWALIPNVAGANTSQYFCDSLVTATGNRTVFRGGCYSQSYTMNGPFAWQPQASSLNNNAAYGYRLQYMP